MDDMINYATNGHAVNQLTNKEYYMGIPRRDFAAKRFGIHNAYPWDVRYKAIVRKYFLTEGNYSVAKTAQHFNERSSSLSNVLKDINPNYKKKRQQRAAKQLIQKPLQVEPTQMGILEKQLIDSIMHLIHSYKAEYRAQLLEKLK